VGLVLLSLSVRLLIVDGRKGREEKEKGKEEGRGAHGVVRRRAVTGGPPPRRSLSVSRCSSPFSNKTEKGENGG
jgi:hypothetical protein